VGHGSLVVDGCRNIFDLVKNLSDESIGALMGVALCSRLIGGLICAAKTSAMDFSSFHIFALQRISPRFAWLCQEVMGMSQCTMAKNQSGDNPKNSS
jgi:hypothetical protein